MYCSNYNLDEIKKDCEEMVRRSELNIKKINYLPNGSNLGGYNLGSKEIDLNEQSIVKTAQENNWSVRDTYLVTLAHELGHASDEDLDTKRYNEKRLLDQYKAKILELRDKRALNESDWDTLTNLIVPYKTVVIDIENTDVKGDQIVVAFSYNNNSLSSSIIATGFPSPLNWIGMISPYFC